MNALNGIANDASSSGSNSQTCKRGQMMTDLINALNLTADQKQNMLNILNQMRPQLLAAKAQIKAARQQMGHSHQPGQFDAATVTANAQTLAPLRLQSVLLMAQLRNQLYGVLTPDQQTAMQNYIAQKKANWKQNHNGKGHQGGSGNQCMTEAISQLQGNAPGTGHCGKRIAKMLSIVNLTAEQSQAAISILNQNSSGLATAKEQLKAAFQQGKGNHSWANYDADAITASYNTTSAAKLNMRVAMGTMMSSLYNLLTADQQAALKAAKEAAKAAHKGQGKGGKHGKGGWKHHRHYHHHHGQGRSGNNTSTSNNGNGHVPFVDGMIKVLSAN